MLVINKKFENTLNRCMYICDEQDELYWELQYISIKFINGLLEEEDCARLFEIEKILTK